MSGSKSFSNKIKSFDMYRKVPQDITQGTSSGAFISIISAFIMLFLFFSEFQEYREVEIRSEMFIDGKRAEENLRINMDIIMHHLPCSMVSLDIQDSMGNHQLNVGGDLFKQKLKKDGKSFELTDDIERHEHEGHNHDQSEGVGLEEVAKQFDNGEGCRLYGFINVKKVPGNFHISSHAFGGILQMLFIERGTSFYDLSHTINHLSFGDQKYIVKITETFNDYGVIAPLDGTQKVSDLDNGVSFASNMFMYYFHVVPTFYETLYGYIYEAHQFTSTSHQVQTPQLAAVYFKFDFSSVAVKYQQSSQSIFHFFVDVCAIIGGIFTIAGLVDVLIYKSIKGLFGSSKKQSDSNSLSM